MSTKLHKKSYNNNNHKILPPEKYQILTRLKKQRLRHNLNYDTASLDCMKFEKK